MKTCNKCNEKRELTNFPKDKRNKDGRQSICYPCRKAYDSVKKAERSLGIGILHKEAKTCNKCKENKAIGMFFKDKGFLDGHASICKSCKTADAMKWREENREKYNETQRKYHKEHYQEYRLKRYDMTPEEHAKMLMEQKGVCALCGKPPTGTKPLVTDHDWETKKVRGLLCYTCNRDMHAVDKPEHLEKAIEYRKRGK